MDLQIVREIRQKQIRTLLLTDSLKKQTQDIIEDFKTQTSNLREALADLETATREVRHLTNQTSTVLDQSIRRFNNIVTEINSNSEETILQTYKVELVSDDINSGTIWTSYPRHTS